jgi:ABC-type spermidine/putrescine transport system permease subunit II
MVASFVTVLVFMLAFTSALLGCLVATTHQFVLRAEGRFYGSCSASRYIRTKLHPDVIVSAGVLTLFVVVEGRRLGMSGLWVPIVGTFLGGVSFGFPLFLYLRHPYTLEPNDALNTGAPKRRAS